MQFEDSFVSPLAKQALNSSVSSTVPRPLGKAIPADWPSVTKEEHQRRIHKEAEYKRLFNEFQARKKQQQIESRGDHGLRANDVGQRRNDADGARGTGGGQALGTAGLSQLRRGDAGDGDSGAAYDARGSRCVVVLALALALRATTPG